MYMVTTNTGGAASIAFCLTVSDRLVVASSVTRGLRLGPAAERHGFCLGLVLYRPNQHDVGDQDHEDRRWLSRSAEAADWQIGRDSTVAERLDHATTTKALCRTMVLY